MNNPNDPLWPAIVVLAGVLAFLGWVGIYPPGDPFRPHWLAIVVLAGVLAFLGWVVGVVVFRG